MIVDIGPLLRGEVNRIDIDYALAPQPIDGVEFSSDAQISGCVTDNAGYMRLALRATLPYATECSRCLCPVEGIFEVDFERTVVTEGMLTEEQIADNVDEYVIVEHGKLDVDEELAESILLEFPTKIVCSDDCEGLCPVCGNPKRDGCSCVEKNIDPRMAPLAKLLAKLDENEE